jgi:hypothetical protein
MKNKRFDCVRMKWKIQRDILKEFSKMSDKDAHKMQMKEVMQSPILGPFCKKVRPVKQTQPM